MPLSKLTSRAGRAAACLLGLLTAGCGSSFYEARLDATANYFGYLHKLDENLHAPWSGGGITVRVPKQFVPDTVKQEVTDEAGTSSEVAIPRPADVFPVQGVELPEVVGAWRAEIEAEQGGRARPAAAYLYAMSNRGLFLDEERAGDADDFHGIVLSQVTSALGEAPPAPTDKRWRQEQFPAAKGYVPKKTLTAITFTPTQPSPDGVVRTYDLYLYQQGDIHVAFLYALPTGISSTERLTERIEMSFATLEVDPTRPTNAPGGVPDGGSRF
ncbi:MAG: hypothetical protein KY476_13240 [Planctomycetes bacterium]|nr:hypothetical protein [Planctomycetota bacterium]